MATKTKHDPTIDRYKVDQWYEEDLHNMDVERRDEGGAYTGRFCPDCGWITLIRVKEDENGERPVERRRCTHGGQRSDDPLDRVDQTLGQGGSTASRKLRRSSGGKSWIPEGATETQEKALIDLHNVLEEYGHTPDPSTARIHDNGHSVNLSCEKCDSQWIWTYPDGGEEYGYGDHCPYETREYEVEVSWREDVACYAVEFVDASSEEEAKEIVQNKWRRGEIIEDDRDVMDTMDFEIDGVW